MKKTITELFDELAITNDKIFSLIDQVEQEDPSLELAKKAKKVQKLNRYRSKLKGAISDYFSERKEIKA